MLSCISWPESCIVCTNVLEHQCYCCVHTFLHLLKVKFLARLFKEFLIQLMSVHNFLLLNSNQAFSHKQAKRKFESNQHCSCLFRKALGRQQQVLAATVA